MSAKTETKRFPLRVVLTCTTGRLLTEGKGDRDNGIGDLYELLGWMTSDSPFTHQLPRFNDECKPWLLRWFPELTHASDALDRLDLLLDQGEPRIAIEAWLEHLLLGMPGVLKADYDVPKIPADDHVRKNAFDELVEMRGTDEGIVLVKAESTP